MSEERQILGVWLLRNEEYFAAWSLGNALAFCDRVLVMDNRSQDRTRAIVDAIAARHSHVEIIGVDDARDTHKYVEDHAGSQTWVFGIDGDEIYDPAGLARLRPRLLAGEFDRYWRLAGHMRHVLGFRFDRAEAFGHIQPAAPEGTKCYNFAAIESWRPGPHERLHGLKTIVYRPGWSRGSTLRLWQEQGWDAADLRCLHLCFMPRSPLDAPVGTSAPAGRDNPVERMKKRSPLRRLRRALLRPLAGGSAAPTYKQRYYARGPVTTFDIAAFGAPESAGALAALEAATARHAARSAGPASG